VAAVTTLLVTALSYGLGSHAATGVGLTFMAATYWVAIRREDVRGIRHYGLSLGGVLEPGPLEVRRLLREAGGAIAWAAGAALLVFPLFWFGYALYWQPREDFSAAPPGLLAEEFLGQLLVIALPEEAFYRGYLQQALDDAWRPRRRLLGASVGPGLVVASALFALGHVLTDLRPERLAVFFPSLLFGWLRARTGGVGASIVFHAFCNLFAWYLALSYGLVP
jgi:hypothetical protein